MHAEDGEEGVRTAAELPAQWIDVQQRPKDDLSRAFEALRAQNFLRPVSPAWTTMPKTLRITHANGTQRCPVAGANG